MNPIFLTPADVSPMPKHVREALTLQERIELLRLWDLGAAAHYLADPPDTASVTRRLSQLLAGKPSGVIAWVVRHTP